MNTRKLYTGLVAVALLAGGTAAQAATVTLEESVRLQMRDASARIQADITATVKSQPMVLDVPGVEIGEIEEIEVADARRPVNRRPLAMPETASVDEALRLDLINRALEVPGMFGVYRYVAAQAATVAIIVAE